MSRFAAALALVLLTVIPAAAQVQSGSISGAVMANVCVTSTPVIGNALDVAGRRVRGAERDESRGRVRSKPQGADDEQLRGGRG